MRDPTRSLLLGEAEATALRGLAIRFKEPRNVGTPEPRNLCCGVTLLIVVECEACGPAA